MTACVLAPLGGHFRGVSFSAGDAAGYIVHNATALTQQWDIAGTPIGVSYPGAWNGSLWSLTFEVGCYVVFGLLLGMTRRPAAMASSLLGASMAITLLHPAWMQAFTFSQAVRLGGFFAAGVLLYHLRNRVPLTSRLAGASMIVVVAGWASGSRAFDAAAPLAFAFLLLWLGATLPTRIGVRNDISYGMYVYAFPVQQVLALAGLNMAPPIFALVSVLGTLPLAWASWRLVERPSMLRARHVKVSLVRRRSRAQRVTAPGPP